MQTDRLFPPTAASRVLGEDSAIMAYQKWRQALLSHEKLDQPLEKFAETFLLDSLIDLMQSKDVQIYERSLSLLAIALSSDRTFQEIVPNLVAQARLFAGDYDGYWDFIRNNRPRTAVTQTYGRIEIPPGISISELLNIKTRCRDTSLRATDILSALGQEITLTQVTRQNFRRFLVLLDLFLDEFHLRHGKSYIDFFMERADGDWEELAEFFTEPAEYRQLKRESLKHRDKTYRHLLSFGIPISLYFRTDQLPSLEFRTVSPLVKQAAINALNNLVRECENTLREELDLPRVGEGWIAESLLYRRLIEAFPDERIIHHGRPAWLGKQHLDIYFPERLIAIEYQGPQHYRPVEYFGGEENFLVQQERDRLKAKLCAENHCLLILVAEGYDFDGVRRQIVARIKERRS